MNAFLLVRLLWLLRLLPLLVRGFWVASWIRLMGGQCGLIFVDKGFSLRSLPHRGVRIGNRVGFGPNVKIFVPASGRLVIGDGCMFTSDVFISALESVEIGAHTLVAEYTSIRDADHRYDRVGMLIKDQGMRASPIVIADNVWIGRGVGILRGSWIGSGAVIGANAVVKGLVPNNTVVVGVPARVIRHRIGEELTKS
jgi:UDP-3-O-[3-hydroxymyristoyl] glucosamine N-acyltransferase